MASQQGKSDIKNSHGRQLKIFEQPSLNPTSRVKAAMREAIKECPLSREQIVDEMNRLAGIEGVKVKISLALLDKWVAQSTPHIIPWKLMPIFCRITENVLPLQALLAPLGATIVWDKDVRLLQWARAEIQRRALSKTARRLLEELGI